MVKNIQKISLSVALLSALAFFAGCGIDNTEENVVESTQDKFSSQFVSAEIIDDINASTMLSVVKEAISSDATNAFGYKAVKITYNTKGQNDEDIVASGLLVIPSPSDSYQAYRASIGEAPFSVSMICDNHGTIFTNAEAPSNVEIQNGMPDYSLAVSMTGYAGFAGIYPDYIGYGTSSDENHPYMLKKASARASLDMIKASMKYMSDEGVALNYQLFISGYSQGGYTAMALAEELESNYSSDVNLMGVAPMAGPHDLKALGDIELDASHTMVYPAFLGYLADSYSQAYLDINISDLVNTIDTTLYHSLFDGSNSNVEIHTGLGLVTDARGGFNQHTADILFKTSIIDDYQNNSNTGATLNTRFTENSTYDWTPSTKMNLIHCSDDEIIPFSMSQKAYDTFVANGSTNITLTPIPTAIIDEATASSPFVHSRCGKTAYGAAVTWFDAIRSGDI